MAAPIDCRAAGRIAGAGRMRQLAATSSGLHRPWRNGSQSADEHRSGSVRVVCAAARRRDRGLRPATWRSRWGCVMPPPTPCTVRGYRSARLLDKHGAALPLKVKHGGGFFPDYSASRAAGRAQAGRPGLRGSGSASSPTTSLWEPTSAEPRPRQCPRPRARRVIGGGCRCAGRRGSHRAVTSSSSPRLWLAGAPAFPNSGLADRRNDSPLWKTRPTGWKETSIQW